MNENNLKPREGDLGTLSRIMALLRVVATGPRSGMRAIDIATAGSVHQATAYRLLKAMETEGLVHRLPSRRYILGGEIHALGNAARLSFDLKEQAIPSLERLAESPGDVAFLHVRSDRHAVCLVRIDGTHPIRPMTLNVRERRPLGVGAGSLALLSAYDDDVVETLTASCEQRGEYEAYFPREKILDDVARTRLKGFAHFSDEVVPGVSSYGVSLVDSNGKPMGSLSCAAINERYAHHDTEKIAELLLRERDRVIPDGIFT